MLELETFFGITRDLIEYLGEEIIWFRIFSQNNLTAPNYNTFYLRGKHFSFVTRERMQMLVNHKYSIQYTSGLM